MYPGAGRAVEGVRPTGAAPAHTVTDLHVCDALAVIRATRVTSAPMSTLPLRPRHALLLAAFASGGGCVHGQRIEALGEAIEAVRADGDRRDGELVALAERLTAAEAALASERERIAALEAERDALAAALEDAREHAERMQWQIARLERSQRTWRDHSSGRFARVERHLGFEPLPPPQGTDLPAADLLPGDLPSEPAQHVAIAREHLGRGDTAVARAILAHALDRVGDAAPAAELRYLMGMSWFQEERWGRAATIFQLVTEAHPDTPWAAWSLIRQGECFREMGDIATARVFLEELVARFPDTDAAADAERLLAELPPTTL